MLNTITKVALSVTALCVTYTVGFKRGNAHAVAGMSNCFRDATIGMLEAAHQKVLDRVVDLTAELEAAMHKTGKYADMSDDERDAEIVKLNDQLGKEQTYITVLSEKIKEFHVTQ